MIVVQEAPRQEEVAAPLREADAWPARYPVDAGRLAALDVRLFVARMEGRAVPAEGAARRGGARVVRLETGVGSREALGLHRGAGHRERGPFGAHAPDPPCVFMEKAPGAP